MASGARAARLKERGGQGLCVRAQHTKILQKQNISKILILELRTFRQLWILFVFYPALLGLLPVFRCCSSRLLQENNTRQQTACTTAVCVDGAGRRQHS